MSYFRKKLQQPSIFRFLRESVLYKGMGEHLPYSSPLKKFFSWNIGVSKTPCAEHFLLNSNYRSEIQAKRKQRDSRGTGRKSRVTSLMHSDSFLCFLARKYPLSNEELHEFHTDKHGQNQAKENCEANLFWVGGPSVSPDFLIRCCPQLPPLQYPIKLPFAPSLAPHCLWIWLPVGSNIRHCPDFWCIYRLLVFPIKLFPLLLFLSKVLWSVRQLFEKTQVNAF